jgi:Family of unknown function (DUF6448)
MRKLLLLAVLTGGFAAATPAAAHCDGADGPVAGAALRALETRNVNLALPYAPAAAEAEITRAHAQALVVRGQGAEARALADHWFMETVVRLHRLGEDAPYTGLKPAGTDYGPVIPAAERALSAGDSGPLVDLLLREARHQIEARLERARALRRAPAEPRTTAEVEAARARISAEFAFIGYAEGLHQALKGGVHAAAAEAHHD